MEKRRNYCILFIGKRFTGKTTMAKKFSEASNLNVIVVNTDRHPAYEAFEEITPEALKTWNGKKCVVFCNDEEETEVVADVLNKYQANALIIFEDAQKYISANPGKAMQRLMINHRMRNFDLVFMYHSLKLVPPKIAANYEIMFLFKTADGLVNLSSKYVNWQVIDKRRARINAHKEIHYCEVIKDHETK